MTPEQQTKLKTLPPELRAAIVSAAPDDRGVLVDLVPVWVDDCDEFCFEVPGFYWFDWCDEGERRESSVVEVFEHFETFEWYVTPDDPEKQHTLEYLRALPGARWCGPILTPVDPVTQ